VSHPAATVFLVAVAYYAGANLGLVLRLPPATPSVLWPPNTILTAALLMSPPRHWWRYLLAALPAHLLAEVGVWPSTLVLAFFVTNCSQALIAAAGLWRFSDAPARFDTLRRVTLFILSAGLAAPFLSSFVDAAAVTVTMGESYWLVWRTRFFSNVLTELVLGPAIVMALTAGPAWVRNAPRARKTEAALLAAALTLVGGWVFGIVTDSSGLIPGGSVLIFLLPLILLVTVMFGPGGASMALLTTSVIAIVAGAHGHGPFASLPREEGVLALQLLLSGMAIPILCLAAGIAERRQAVRDLAEQLRLEMLLSRLCTTFLYLPSYEMEPAFTTSVGQIGRAAGVDRVILWRQRRTDERVTRYTWSAPGAGQGLAVRPEHDFPWTLERVRGDEMVVFSRLEELPAAAARDVESFRRHGIRSAIIVPLVETVQARGTLCLFTVSTERTWPDGLQQWLRLVGEALTSALARKEAEDALRASELSKSAILTSLNNAVAVLDLDGRIVDVNASWVRAAAEPALRIPAGLAVGVNLLQAWQQAARDGMPYASEAAAGILGVLRGGREEFSLEYSSRGAAGEQWFVMSVVPLDHADGGAVVSSTEVTERKEAELEVQRSRQELAHFARVSTVGQLTASIAHELNQPLTGILTNAQAGLRFLDAGPPDVAELRDILSDIVDDDKRAAEVIQRLREILRKGEIKRVLLDVNVLVADVARLLNSDAIIRNVAVTLDLHPRPVLAYGDRVELQQVILNLLINAMDAMAEITGGDRTIVVTTETTLESVHVAVRDRGKGISTNGSDRLFEPFFTTKPSGMGMGLAIARSVIEGHGGVIWATDNAGGGAVFHFALPAAVADPV
jgi:C4-dicarboxylate-specific signal transduction histidine kinase/integral membrane sensor domain MASE1